MIHVGVHSSVLFCSVSFACACALLFFSSSRFCTPHSLLFSGLTNKSFSVELSLSFFSAIALLENGHFFLHSLWNSNVSFSKTSTQIYTQALRHTHTRACAHTHARTHHSHCYCTYKYIYISNEWQTAWKRTTCDYVALLLLSWKMSSCLFRTKRRVSNHKIHFLCFVKFDMTFH